MAQQTSILIKDSDKEDVYEKVFALEEGDVFQIVNPMQYETLLFRLEKYKPENITIFSVEYVPMGHPLYSIYGYNTIAVTKKQ